MTLVRLVAALSLLGAACAQSDTQPVAKRSGVTPSVARTRVVTKVAAKTAAARAGGVALSVDTAGVPRFIRATTNVPVPAGATAAKAARSYVGRFARAYGVSSAALDSLRVVRVHDIGRGGIIVVLRHRVAGIDVHGADIKVLLRRNLQLVAIAGAPVAGALPQATLRPGAFRAQPADALATALTEHFKVPVVASWVTNLRRVSGGFYALDLAKGTPVTLSRSARAKKIMYPVAGKLVPAWFVEFFASDRMSTGSDAYQYIVAGNDTRVLSKKNLSAADSYSYRVWADPTTKHPADGPLADRTPYPGSAPTGDVPPAVASSLVSVEGLNTNPMGQADPWLPAGGTVSHGNNADVYSDSTAPDGFTAGSDLRADVTSAGTFDYTYDLGAMPLADATQTKAAIVQAFYVVNWLHDWFYDSGFNESAGNGQGDNFGRGGEGGDELLIEVQDSYNDGQRNNANMSTPFDGASPRMQIYVWSGPQNFNLTLSSTGGTVDTNGASFGPGNFDISGNVVLIDDGTGTSTDGCEAITNNITGSIALIDRGNCSFATKVENAQDAGAIGVLVANNQVGQPAMFMGGGSDVVTIGSLSLGYDDGQALKTALGAGTVTTTMQKSSGVEREGGLDSALVAHEWGHYIHHRLADCGAQQCGGMSEGWGDFIALYLMIRDGDNLDGAYGSAAYAASGFADVWYGTRRTTYSVDPSLDALMFRHISDAETLPSGALFQPNGAANSEVHNTGEVWATMMLEAYVALIRDRETRGGTFAEARRAMGDYIVAGLQMTPRDATITEQRDAILAAADAANHNDAVAMAGGFAERGAGSCAVSPSRDSQDNTGVVESTDVKARLIIGNVQLEPGRDCDADGVLDASESAMLHVTIVNGSLLPVNDTTVSFATPTMGAQLGQTSVMIPALDAYSSTTVDIPVELGSFVEPLSVLELQITATNDAACEPSVMASLVQRVNSDDAPASTTTDTVEASETPWTRTGGDAAQAVWNIDASDPADRFWSGVDYGAPSDTALESPDLVVSDNDPLVITFSHRYQFEMSQGTAWDGGVVEISTDGGQSWADVGDYGVDPGYRDQITDQSGNPLGLRNALVGASPSWPDFEVATLDFGNQLAGQTVRLRFRIGTDAAVGDIGWQIDDIGVSGIDNTPFSAVVDNAGVCGLAVDAGPDYTVEGGSTVVLRARAAASAGADLTFAWTQDSGDTVSLWYPDSAVSTFTAPMVEEAHTYKFSVELSDGTDSTSDSVTIKVVPRGSGGGGGSHSGGCQAGGNGGGASVLLVLLLLALVTRRRRRDAVVATCAPTEA